MRGEVGILKDVVDEAVYQSLERGQHISLTLGRHHVHLQDGTCLVAHLLHDHQLLLGWNILAVEHADEVLQACGLVLLRVHGCATTIHGGLGLNYVQLLGS